MNELERSLAFCVTEAQIAFVKTLEPEQIPKVSVVIPTLNQAPYLPQALESVLDQEYPKLEVLVVDGCSNDETLEILQEYSSTTKGLIRYISEEDEGQYHAVNKGLQETDGEIIAWLNSDDAYLDDAFWKVVTFFHFNQSVFIVYGRNKYTNQNLEEVFDYPVDWSPLISEQHRKMMHFCLPPQPSLFFKRSAVTLAGALRSPILDYELWLRWQKDFQFYFLDDYLSLSRLHKDAKTIRERRDLILGIMKTVHEFYHIVSMNWTLSLAYHEAYGDTWLSGEQPPVTRKIRFKAWFYWFLYNARWMPRGIISICNSTFNLIRESIRGKI